jgi:hypothetical protein
MRSAALIGFGSLLMLASPTAAQEAAVRETRCWVGDVVFSAGMSVNMGDEVAVAGCVLEGEFSSVGAVVGIRNSDEIALQCDRSGHWVTLEL